MYSGDGKPLHAIRANGNLIINNGTLVLQGLGGGVFCNKDITINGGKINFSGGVNRALGIQAANLIMNGGEIASFGIMVQNKMIVNGGSILSDTDRRTEALGTFTQNESGRIISSEPLKMNI